MFRKLTNNECKEWINDFYLKYKSNGDHEYYMLSVNDKFFQINILGKGLLCDLINNKDIEELKFCTHEYCKWYGYNIKDYRLRIIKYFYFLTASGGKQKILVNESNLDIMYKLNKKIFTNEIYKRFHKVYWNIETGKKINDPNLHTHALIIFDSTNKNFDRDYRNSFKKAFGNIDLQIQKFGWRGNIEIYEDKLSYLKNINKSILHKNYKDLEIFEHLE